jgi:hypothetical protein
MHVGGPPDQPGAAVAPGGGIVAPLQVVFEHPLPPAQQLVIARVRDLLLRHTFELHDISSAGERIERVPVGATIPQIELRFGENPQVMVAAFYVRSREGKQILVWASSLFFQYVHYHVARIVSVNGNPHQMDWEAAQDPTAQARVKGWVEGGTSLIERMHRSGQ